MQRFRDFNSGKDNPRDAGKKTLPVLIWKYFVFSVWLLIIYCTLDFLGRANYYFKTDYMLNSRFRNYPGAGLVIFPLIVAIIEGMLWFTVYKLKEDGSKIMAGVMGFSLFLYSFIMIGNAKTFLAGSIFGFKMHRFLIYFYTALAHLAYAFLGEQNLPKIHRHEIRIVEEADSDDDIPFAR